MTVATLTPEIISTAPIAPAHPRTNDLSTMRLWARRLALALFIGIGVVATAVILIKLGAFAVYGLPAPLLRRAA
jgi:hypothetical protein